MRKLMYGVMSCCFSLAAACGGDAVKKEEEKAVEAGKTTMTYTRSREVQTTSLEDPQAVKSCVLVFKNDEVVRQAISKGVLSREGQDGHDEVVIRNLKGNPDAETFYIMGTPVTGSEERAEGLEDILELALVEDFINAAESGVMVLQSDMTPSFIATRQSSEDRLVVPDSNGDTVSKEDFRKGVEVDFNTSDGKQTLRVRR